MKKLSLLIFLVSILQIGSFAQINAVVRYPGEKIWESNTSPVDLAYKLESDWLKLPKSISGIVPSALYVNEKDEVYVLDHGTKNNPSILVFDENGKYLSRTMLKGFLSPHYFQLDKKGNWWISDSKSHQISKINKQGEIVFSFGEYDVSGWDETHFNRPTDICFMPDERILISDGYQNQRIAIYDSSFKYISEWGQKGEEPGNFILPHAITFGTDGRLYISDRDAWRVQIFSTDGDVLEVWPHIGKVYDLVETPDKHFFCLDGVTSRITKVDSKGKVIGFFGTPEVLDKAHALALMSNGDIIVATTAGKLVKYSK